MEQPKALSTCECGSTEFEEIQVRLPVIETSPGKTLSANRELWARVCSGCTQVTFWSEKRTARQELSHRFFMLVL
jgi:hypothetical protein